MDLPAGCMKPGIFLLLLLFAGQAFASSVVMVDGADWGFKFAPTLAQTRKTGSVSANFQFEGMTEEGFIVSGFGESAKG